VRHLLSIFLILTFALVPSLACAMTPPPSPTERDWMVNLVESLGLSFGLPDQPEDDDYLKILGGERTFRFEAEDAKQEGDMVSVKDFRTFGSFSGKGWVSGIATATRTHLKFLLPRGGTYEVRAALRVPGFTFVVAGRSYPVDGGTHLEEVSVATVEMAAGPQEIIVDLPPDGAIDYLQLTAPALAAIEPADGWHLDAPLDKDVMAVTAARALSLEPLLPLSGATTVIEGETAPVPKGAAIVTSGFLGQPSGGAWVRGETALSLVRLPFAPPQAGVYDLWVRGLSERPLEVSINDRFGKSLPFPPYLETLPAGTYSLAADGNTLEISLPLRAGFDALILKGRSSGGSDYCRLAGLLPNDTPPTLGEIDALLSLLATLAPAP